MATFTQLPSKKWRVQVRKHGCYRSATFSSKATAKAWANEIERQLSYVAISGYAPPPKGATLGDLLDLYIQEFTIGAGKTKVATLRMLRRRLGMVKLEALSALVLRDFVDQRCAEGAGGVTIAADLSFLSAVLKWAKHSRRIDVPDRLALDAREALKHRGLNTRGKERSREPTVDEMDRLCELWRSQKRRKIDMETIMKFALASGMRLGEICRLRIEDYDAKKRTIVIRDRKDPRSKIGNHQEVPLLPAAFAIVQDQIGTRERGLIFDAKPASVSAAFTRGCAELGIDDLRFHDLRHLATAEFFRAGLDIPRVALLTGHKTWAMLRRYTLIRPQDVHQAYLAGERNSAEKSVGDERMIAGW